MAIHLVLARHLRALGEMVHFLVTVKALVDLHLDVGRSPADGPLVVALSRLTEAIVFEGVTEESDDYIVVELEVVALVRGQVRSNVDRVDVRPENQKLLLLYVIHRSFGSKRCLIS